MSAWLHRSLAPCLLMILVAAGCEEKKGEGETCSSNDECASGLTCDKHGGTTGKCYPPHGHGTDAGDTRPPDTSGASGGTGGSGGSGGTGGSGGSGGTGGSGGSGGSGGTGGSTTDAPSDSPRLDQAPDTTADATSPADMSAPGSCATLCACLTSNCASVSGYPYANMQACLQACGGLSAAERTCRANFCTMAASQMGATRAHNCEHAWGSHGMAECN